MKQQKTFHYPEVMGNHFLHQHSVDDHNNKQHSPISLEVVWAMKYWPKHVFAFLLSLAVTYFSGQQQMGQIKFWKLLAKHNYVILTTMERRTRHLIRSTNSGNTAIASSHSPRAKTFSWHMNHPSKQPISTTQMHFLHKKYLLPMLPRNILVC